MRLVCIKFLFLSSLNIAQAKSDNSNIPGIDEQGNLYGAKIRMDSLFLLANCFGKDNQKLLKIANIIEQEAKKRFDEISDKITLQGYTPNNNEYELEYIYEFTDSQEIIQSYQQSHDPQIWELYNAALAEFIKKFKKDKYLFSQAEFLDQLQPQTFKYPLFEKGQRIYSHQIKYEPYYLSWLSYYENKISRTAYFLIKENGDHFTCIVYKGKIYLIDRQTTFVCDNQGNPLEIGEQRTIKLKIKNNANDRSDIVNLNQGPRDKIGPVTEISIKTLFAADQNKEIIMQAIEKAKQNSILVAQTQRFANLKPWPHKGKYWHFKYNNKTYFLSYITQERDEEEYNLFFGIAEDGEIGAIYITHKQVQISPNKIHEANKKLNETQTKLEHLREEKIRLENLLQTERVKFEAENSHLLLKDKLRLEEKTLGNIKWQINDIDEDISKLEAPSKQPEPHK